MTETSLRGARQRERLERLRANVPPGVRVTPANDAMRRLLKHPTRGGFPSTGGVEWPNDKYTKKRLAEGSIKREDEAGAETTEQTSRSRSTATPDSSTASGQ